MKPSLPGAVLTAPTLPRAFKLSRVGYYADFALTPLAALGLLTIELTARPRAGIAALVALGFVLWQLAEYLIHRYAFHGPLRALHDVHHRRPAAYIGIASWGTAAAFALFWAPAALLFGAPTANGVIAGALLGYLAYIAIHDRMHHGDRTRFSRYVAFMFRFHAGHHRGGHANFGVTSPLFDLILRTYR